MSIANSLIWSYVERWGNKVITLLVFIVLARLLDPKDFGLVAFAKLFIDYLDDFAGQGLGIAIVQRKEIKDTHLNTAFLINVISGTCLSLMLILLAPLIERMFGETDVVNVIRALTAVIVINSLSRVQIAILNREQRYKQLTQRGLLMSVAGGVVGITMAVNGYGVWSLVSQQLAIGIVALTVLWRTTSWRPRMSFSFASAKDLYSFASRVFVSQQVLFASKRLDEVLIAFFLGVTLLGYYSIAKRLFETLVDMAYTALSLVLVSAFSKVQNDLTAMLVEADKVTIVVAAIFFPVFIGGAVVSMEIIIVVFGDRWALSALPLSVLMVSGVLLLTPTVIHTVFLALGRPNIPLLLNTARTIASALSISIGSYFGIVGIACGVLIRNLFGAMLDIFLFRKIANDNYAKIYWVQLKYISYCLPMAVGIVAIRMLLDQKLSGVFLLLVLFIFGLLIYFVTLVIFKASVLQYMNRYLKILSK